MDARSSTPLSEPSGAFARMGAHLLSAWNWPATARPLRRSAAATVLRSIRRSGHPRHLSTGDGRVPNAPHPVNVHREGSAILSRRQAHRASSPSAATSTREIWLADADGLNVTRLTRGPGRQQGSPSWSPDGRVIAFDSQAEDGRKDIWTIGADGSGMRQITREPRR